LQRGCAIPARSRASKSHADRRPLDQIQRWPRYSTRRQPSVLGGAVVFAVGVLIGSS